MKTIHITMLGTILTLMLVSPLMVQAAEVASVVSDHQAFATSYKEKAMQQDELIAEHQEMKKNYEGRFYINEKLTPKNGLHGDMYRHCDAIIQVAQMEKSKLLEFAKWHEMRAAELRGQ